MLSPIIALIIGKPMFLFMIKYWGIYIIPIIIQYILWRAFYRMAHITAQLMETTGVWYEVTTIAGHINNISTMIQYMKEEKQKADEIRQKEKEVKLSTQKHETTTADKQLTNDVIENEITVVNMCYENIEVYQNNKRVGCIYIKSEDRLSIDASIEIIFKSRTHSKALLLKEPCRKVEVSMSDDIVINIVE
jgi:hypothetical protein